MKLLSKCLLMLTMLLTISQGTWAQVNYIERSWDATSKTVVSTTKTLSGSLVGDEATPSEGDYKVVSGESDSWFQMGGYANTAEYYVIRGTVSRKTIVVLGKDVHLILCDGAKLTLTGGLKLEVDNKIHIHSQSYGSSMGQLIVTNSYKNAAGIGSAQLNGSEMTVGELVIHGGHITATGGEYGAGIGSCAKLQYTNNPTKCNAVTVYGGYVKATGGKNAAGIGGGTGYNHFGVDGGTFTLYDGTVIAEGGDYASGVGGGGSWSPTFSNWSNGGEGGVVNIYGGTLTATGGIKAAGIGSGNLKGWSPNPCPSKLCGGVVNIYGGTVTATGGEYGAGIGGGDEAGGATVKIEGGTVTATGGEKAPGIGGGYEAMGGNVTITGGTVIAKAGTQGGSGNRAIGPGKDYETYGTLTIGDKMMVGAGNNGSVERTVGASERRDACWYRSYAKIETCLHNGCTYTSTGNTASDTHLKHCNYCSTPFIAERHSFDSNNICTVCGIGAELNVSVFVFTPNEEGTGYTMISYNMIPNSEFVLPRSKFTPEGLEFAGWFLVNQGSEYGLDSFIASEGETLLQEQTPYTIRENVTFIARFNKIKVIIANASNNTETLGKYNGKLSGSVTLAERTLYKDGSWNTLCLPFALTSSQVTEMLAPDKLMTLGSTVYEDGTLTLNFEDATEIKAGKPYILKWDRADGYVDDNEHNIYEPTFTDVTISLVTEDVTTEYLDFVGTFSPKDIYNTEDSYLFLGAENALYYPDTEKTVNSCRAYFRLNNQNEDQSGSGNAVKAFRMNFGETATDIDTLPVDAKPTDNSWFTIDGRKLKGKPTQKGIYIQNGQKFIIK